MNKIIGNKDHTKKNINIISENNKNEINELYFFRYKNNSCWVDCFLFTFKYIFYKFYSEKDFSLLNINIYVEEFLKDISTIEI